MTNDVFELSAKKEKNIQNSDDDDFEDPTYDFETYEFDKIGDFIPPCQQEEKLIINDEEIAAAQKIVQVATEKHETSSTEVSTNNYIHYTDNYLFLKLKTSSKSYGKIVFRVIIPCIHGQALAINKLQLFLISLYPFISGI